MSKRRAILLFGGTAVFIAAYVAWCGRDFMLRPKIAISNNLPEETRRGITDCYQREDPFSPTPITATRLWRAVSNPYRVSRTEAFVIAFREDFVAIETSRSEWCYFELVDGNWKNSKLERLAILNLQKANKP
jgi:hypothetical protein